jgi:hypothetical protein
MAPTSCHLSKECCGLFLLCCVRLCHLFHHKSNLPILVEGLTMTLLDLLRTRTLSPLNALPLLLHRALAVLPLTLTFRNTVSHRIVPSHRGLPLLFTLLRRRITAQPTNLEDAMPNNELPTSERTHIFSWSNQTEFFVNYAQSGFNSVKIARIAPIPGCSIGKNVKLGSKFEFF